MRSPNHSFLDQCLIQFDLALRTCIPGPSQARRAPPAEAIDDSELSAGERRHTAGLMRINHTGEVCAQALYQGQAATAKLGDVRESMQHAAAEEVDHLAWCEQRIVEHGYAPSRLGPFWYAGAFLVGAASGLLGDKWSLGFIDETEKQVCAHLESHLDQLPENDARSRAIVAKMRDEEAEHGENAIDAGAAQLPRPIVQMMRAPAKIKTKTAYLV